MFKAGDCVWVKLRGFPHWPARIDKIDRKQMCTLFFFGTHEIGRQKTEQLLPFDEENREKFTVFNNKKYGRSLLEGVLEAEENPEAKPKDTLTSLKTDLQMWTVMGATGRAEFRARFPKRAAAADKEFAQYEKELKFASYQEEQGECSRKRTNSESMQNTSPSPARKKRRTQSESLASSYAENMSRPEQISELCDCLRYSLRQSSLNRIAAQTILSELETLCIDKSEASELLLTSLDSVTRLQKLPLVREQSQRLLDQINL